MDTVAREVLPSDSTPSLGEIAASPSVAHLGEPTSAPQKPTERLRIVVSGNDAALGAVLTRMMRADYLWAEIAYIPTDPHSPAAVLWDIPERAATDLALSGPVRPIPCIRNDSGVAVAGSATLTNFDGGLYIGEIVVDNDVLLFNDSPTPTLPGPYGARLVPTVDAPGIAAAKLVTPATEESLAALTSARRHRQLGQRVSTAAPPRWWRRSSLNDVTPAMTDPNSVLTGRALQSGGESILVTIDGVDAPRPVNRVTFYRHLRDIQSVRP